MKYGYRKPSIKKSVKASTTGKINRSIKKAINPLYGKKGMGYVNNPKKAIYNSVYNKTTFGARDMLENNTENYDFQCEDYDFQYKDSTINNNKRKVTVFEKISFFVVGAVYIIGALIAIVPALLVLYAIFWVLSHI